MIQIFITGKRKTVNYFLNKPLQVNKLIPKNCTFSTREIFEHKKNPEITFEVLVYYQSKS